MGPRMRRRHCHCSCCCVYCCSLSCCCCCCGDTCYPSCCGCCCCGSCLAAAHSACQLCEFCDPNLLSDWCRLCVVCHAPVCLQLLLLLLELEKNVVNYCKFCCWNFATQQQQQQQRVQKKHKWLNERSMMNFSLLHCCLSCHHWQLPWLNCC